MGTIKPIFGAELADCERADGVVIDIKNNAVRFNLCFFKFVHLKRG